MWGKVKTGMSSKEEAARVADWHYWPALVEGLCLFEVALEKITINITKSYSHYLPLMEKRQSNYHVALIHLHVQQFKLAQQLYAYPVSCEHSSLMFKKYNLYNN